MAPTDVEVERAERVPARARRAVGVSPAPSKPARRGMTTWTVGTFFALTFALGWGVLGVLILFTARIEAVFGPVSMNESRISSRRLLARHLRCVPRVAPIRLGGPAQLPQACHPMAHARRVVGVPLLGIPAIVYVSAAIGGTITDGSRSRPGTGCSRLCPSRSQSVRWRSSDGAALRSRCCNADLRRCGPASYWVASGGSATRPRLSSVEPRTAHGRSGRTSWAFSRWRSS